LVLYSDGVVEARNDAGEFFGTQRLADFVARTSAGLPAPETLRRLNLAILDNQDGNLQDDATTLLIGWNGAVAEPLSP
jgi:serine phosphatase RsbU (regulator of sigma subunit)